jgi:hypothetical protein
MARILTKKRALLVAAATSLALVAVALAFYATTGSGSGSGGTTASGYPNALVITGTANASTLVPGGSVPISNGNIHNGNTGSAKHGTITGSVDAAAAGCSDSYFHVTNVTPAGSSDVIAAGGDRTFTATLTMDDDVNNSQDACKSTGLTITWSST